MRPMLLALLAALWALAGCAKIDNPLSLQDIAALKVTGVEVRYAPNSSIFWPKAETEYVEKVKPGLRSRGPSTEINIADQGEDPYQKVVKSPEAQAFMRAKLTGLIEDRLRRQIIPKASSGTRAVKLEVEVMIFSIPPAGYRIVMGGKPVLGARVVLRDTKTGAQLAMLDQAAAGMAGNGVIGVLIDQGFADLEDRVLDAWTAHVESWLLKKGTG